MTSAPAPPSGDASEEISVLIRTLRETDQRLDELNAGQIDTVADRDGRSFLLHHAQGELRYADALDHHDASTAALIRRVRNG